MSINATAVAVAVPGLDIPFLRQVIGLIFLAFIPGLLILRILRFHDIGPVDTVLYAVGLSITLVMFLGLLMNLAYPGIGVSRPIDTVPVTITLAAVVTALCAFAYLRERRRPAPAAAPRPFAWTEALSPPALLLVLLPLLSVLGTYLVNSSANNVLLLVLFGLIALVAALIGFNRFIPRRLYPLAVVMISLSLLWHWSLISGYLWGWDIHYEYYYQSQVLANGVWDPGIFSNVNSMLSVVMLAPISSLVLGMDSVWVFKIVYPLFFSLLPLALFQVFRRQSDDRLGFLAAFLFISFSAFFADLAQLARQQVAELFFALFIMALLDNLMTERKKVFLLIVFGMSIVVSHYGLAYFFLFYLVLSALILVLARNRVLGNLWDNLRTRFPGTAADPPPADVTTAGSLTVTMVFLMIVFCFAWYMYLGKGSPFNSIVYIGIRSMNSLKELFAVESREAGVLMAVGLSGPGVASVQRNVFLILQYVIQLCIAVGVAGVILKTVRSRFQPVFVAMTLVSTLLLAMCIVLPRFSMNFNIARIYHITLLFLSPYCLIGGLSIFRWLYRLATFRFSRPAASPVLPALVGVLLLVPYFLFSTGFVYAVTGDEVTSMALNPELDTVRFNQREVAAKAWLLDNITAGRGILADYYGAAWLVEPSLQRKAVFWGDTATVPENCLISLRTVNARGLVIASGIGPRHYIDLAESPFGRDVLASRSRIYDDGGAQVYDAGKD